MDKIRVGIIGAAGYTAGELLRVLYYHPNVKITSLQSESNAGNKVNKVHKDLFFASNLIFEAAIDPEKADVFFLCKGHGASASILAENPKLLDKNIVDLSQDFRLKGSHDFVYGLPEINKEAIKQAKHIANPGCFATSIQLGILPLIASGKIKDDLHVSGITGSTGAGQALSATSHFSWRSNNASVYKALNHQHLLEIGETVRNLTEFEHSINFIPYRGAFTRGIITTSYVSTDFTEVLLKQLYDDFYKDAAFTAVMDENPDLKQVVNTNYGLVFPSVIGEKAVIVSIIDNLLKGASGQAIQNMNLMMGLKENDGLNLKPGGY